MLNLFPFECDLFPAFHQKDWVSILIQNPCILLLSSQLIHHILQYIPISRQKKTKYLDKVK